MSADQKADSTAKDAKGAKEELKTKADQVHIDLLFNPRLSA
jgi:hypothetical protein